jgi:hypothetical protein
MMCVNNAEVSRLMLVRHCPLDCLSAHCVVIHLPSLKRNYSTIISVELTLSVCNRLQLLNSTHPLGEGSH